MQGRSRTCLIPLDRRRQLNRSASQFKAEIEAFLNCFCGIASAFAESECSWLLTKLVSLVCIELNLCLLKLFAVCRLCLVDFDVVCSGIVRHSCSEGRSTSTDERVSIRSSGWVSPPPTSRALVSTASSTSSKLHSIILLDVPKRRVSK